MTIDDDVRRLPTQEITTHTDSREILANAARDTERYSSTSTSSSTSTPTTWSSTRGRRS